MSTNSVRDVLIRKMKAIQEVLPMLDEEDKATLARHPAKLPKGAAKQNNRKPMTAATKKRLSDAAKARFKAQHS